MKTQTRTLVAFRASWMQVVLFFIGLAYLWTGLIQLFAPLWFFEHIGTFPPFNRHYVGDLGAFLLPLGLGLVIAARDPFRERALVGVAAGGSFLHALNHLYDDWLAGNWTPAHLLSETLPLVALALLLLVVWWKLGLMPRAIST
jgi:hypothetical protein